MTSTDLFGAQRPPLPGRDQRSLVDQLTGSSQTQEPQRPTLTLAESLLQETRRREDMRLHQAFSLAVKGDPNRVAEAQRLGVEFGQTASGEVEPLFIERNLEFFRGVIQERKLRADATRMSPMLRAQLADPRLARIAFDDVDNLGFFEGIAKNFETGGVSFRASILRHRKHSGAATREELMELDRLEERLLLLPKRATGLLTGTASFFGQMSEAFGEAGEEALALSVTGASMGAIASATTGPLAPVAAPVTAAGGFLLGLGVGATAGISRAFMEAGAGARFEDLKPDITNGTLSYQTALNLANLQGFMEAGLEVTGIGFLSGVLPPPARRAMSKALAEGVDSAFVRPTIGQAAKTALKGYVMGTGAEITQEVVQDATSMLQDIGIDIAAGREIRDLDALNRFADTAVETFKMVGLLGGIAPAVRLRADVQAAQISERQHRDFARLMDVAESSALRGRSESAFEQFARRQLGDDPATEVFLEPQRVRDALEQGQIPIEEFEKAVPGITEQLREAERTDVELAIPMATYTAKLAGTRLDSALRQDVKFEPNGKSLRDAKEVLDKAEQIVEEESEAVAEQMETNQAFAAGAKEVEDLVFAQIVATGTMNNRNARDSAEAFSAVIQAITVRLNNEGAKRGEAPRTPAEVHAENPVTIVGERPRARPGSDLFTQGQEVLAFHGGEAIEGDFDEGTFFTTIEEDAQFFADDRAGEGGVVTPVQIRVSNPLNLSSAEGRDKFLGVARAAGLHIVETDAGLTVSEDLSSDVTAVQDLLSFPQVRAALRREGFDAVLFLDPVEDRRTPAIVPLGPVKRLDSGGELFTQPDLESPEFQAWFGESKVVDEQGKPLVVFKGMDTERTVIDRPSTFPAFNRGEEGIEIAGFFARNRETAERFTHAVKPAGPIQSFYLSFQNPKIIDATGMKAGDVQFFESGRGFREAVRSGEFDGVIIENTEDEGTIYVALRPEQIKSTDNRGTFDPNDPDILKQDAAPSLVRVAGLESSRELATSTPWGRIVNFKQALQERVRAAAEGAGVTLIEKDGEIERVSESAEDHLVLVGVADVLAALRENPNAVGWYSERVRQALTVMAELHPEILTDDNAKFAFVWITAVTSNGLEVTDNFRLAQKVYASFKATGEMPTNAGVGTSADAMNTSLELFNTLREDWGMELFRKVMLTRATVGMIQNGIGRDVSGENVDAPAIGAGVLGAKIGNGFFANLNGLFDMLTMDRWLVRSWGRWSGLLIYDRPDLVAAGESRLTAAISDLTPEARAQIEGLTAVEEVVDRKGKTRLRTLNLDIDLSADPGVVSGVIRKWSEKPEGRAALNEVVGGEELRRAGNSLFANMFKQKEDPANGAERNYIRRVFTRILTEVRTEERWSDLEMADLQAALWFAEKRLYDASKADPDVAGTGNTGYIDNEAPDYANAAVTVAKENGIDDQATDQALRAGRSAARRAAASRRRSGVRGAEARVEREGGLTPSERKLRFGGFVIQRARANRADAKAASWSLRRAHRGGSRESGLLESLGVRVTAEFSPGQLLANRFKALGIGTQKVFELDPADPGSAAKFHSSISSFKKHPDTKKRRDAAAVFVHDQEAYAQMRLFLTASGRSGVAVKPDGDIVSVFSAEGNGRMMVEVAIANGGTHADAFDTVLPDIYAAHGLRVVSRTKWDESQKPRGWNKRHFKDYNGGRPDVVFMVYDPGYVGVYGAVDGVTGSFEEAVSVQQRAIREVAGAQRGQAQAFAHEGEAGPRGEFDPNNLIIALHNKADLSTFLHETAHFYLEVLGRIVSSKDAPPELQQDFQTFLDWVGVDSVQTWNGMTIEEQRAHHESFAVSFEKYLFEGRAPSKALEGLFQKFRSWLIHIYRTLLADVPEHLDKSFRQRFGKDIPQLSDEVRGVFNRMLATDAEIAQMEAQRSMAPLFRTQQESGMSDAEWGRYQDAVIEAHERAVTDHNKASLRQMQWLSRARGRILKELQAQHDEQRRQVRKEAERDVGAQRVYRIQRYLRTGELVDSNGDSVGTEEEGHKLDRELTRALLPEGQNLNAVRGMTAEGGQLPDVVADLFGYESGQAMIADVAEAKPLAEAVTEETDERMLRDHGEMVDPVQRSHALEEALHNEARARFVAVELNHLQGSTRPWRLVVAAAKEAARTILARTPIQQIRPRSYASAEARAAREAQEASRAGDSLTARRAKQRQLLNHELARESAKALQGIEKTRRSMAFQGVRRSDKKLAKSRDVNMVGAARAILAAHEFPEHKGPKATAPHLERVKKFSPERYEEIRPVVEMAAANAKPWKELTLEEFRGLADSIEALWFMALREKTILIEGRRESIEGIVDKLLQSIAAQDPKERHSAFTREDDKGFRRGDWLAQVRRIESWAVQQDGGVAGQVHKYLFAMLRSKFDDYVSERLQIERSFSERLKTLNMGDGQKISAPELNGYSFENKAALLGALRHAGNESNLRKLLLGEKMVEPLEDGQELNPAPWWAFIERMIRDGKITKADLDYIQFVWDTYDSLLQRTQDAHFRVFGFFFEHIPAQPFTTSLGDYGGGYVPIRYDTRRPEIREDPVRESDPALAAIQRSTNTFRNSVEASRGFAYSRVEYNKPMLLDIRLDARHLDEHLRFLHMQPAASDVLALLRDKRLAAALARKEPNVDVVRQMFLPWIDTTVHNRVITPGTLPQGVEEFLTFLRRVSGAGIMFGNLRVALQQLTGFGLALPFVKTRYLAGSFVQLFGGGIKGKGIEKSDFMRLRVKEKMGQLRDDFDVLLENPLFSKVKDLSRHAFFLQAAFQNVVDITVWDARYEQSIAEGMSEEDAIRSADSAVRLSQGSGAAPDLSPIEKGTPLHRLILQFSNFWFTGLNVILSRQTLTGRALMIGNMMLFAGLLAGVMTKVLEGGWDDDDQDGDLWDEFWPWAVGESVNAGLAARLPFIGPALMRVATGEFGGRINPGGASFGQLEAMVRGLALVKEPFTEDGLDLSGRDVSDIFALINLVLPATQVGRSVGFAVGVERGDIEPTSDFDYYRGLLTGRASEASRR